MVVLHNQSSTTCRPCSSGGKYGAIPLSHPISIGLLHLTTGSASTIQVTKLHIGSLALRPAISPLGNLQPLITQTLLPGTTKVYGQPLWRDFNPLDQSPMTAYGQFSLCSTCNSYVFSLDVTMRELTPNPRSSRVGTAHHRCARGRSLVGGAHPTVKSPGFRKLNPGCLLCLSA